MRKSNFRLAYFVLCLWMLQSTSAVTKFSTVGVYDADGQGNTVDKSASFDRNQSSGMGMSRFLVLDVDEFLPLLLTASTNSQGGVVNFDNALIKAGNKTDSFAAFFNGKAVLFKSEDHIRSDYISSSRTPISGPGEASGGGFLAKSTVMGDVCNDGGSYHFALTEYGFEPDEHVRAVAGTILGRNGGAQYGKWTMKVTLDNGDIVGASAIIDLASGNTMDDTFFGAVAPEGRYITGASWISGSGDFSGLDDLAVITSTSNFPVNSIVVDAERDPPTITEPPTSAAGTPSSEPGDVTLFGVEKPWK